MSEKIIKNNIHKENLYGMKIVKEGDILIMEGMEYNLHEYFDQCASCGVKFTPSDHQNDICDKCLYKR